MVSFLVYKGKKEIHMETVTIIAILWLALIILFAQLGWGSLMFAMICGLAFVLVAILLFVLIMFLIETLR